MCIRDSQKGKRATRRCAVRSTLRGKEMLGSLDMCIRDRDTAKLLVDTFLATEHEGGRHARRVELIDSLPLE